MQMRICVRFERNAKYGVAIAGGHLLRVVLRGSPASLSTQSQVCIRLTIEQLQLQAVESSCVPAAFRSPK